MVYTYIYIYLMDIHTNLHMNICLSLSEYCTLRVKVMCFEGQGDKLYLHMLHSCLVVSKFKHLFFSWGSWSQPTSTFWGMGWNPHTGRSCVVFEVQTASFRWWKPHGASLEIAWDVWPVTSLEPHPNQMGGFLEWGTQKLMLCNGKKTIKMDDN